MNTLDTIKSRRAVKHYEKDFKMPEKDIACLIEHMLQAPTSFNLQHWRIVQVEDPAIREQMRAAAWGQEQVSDASLLFIICANTQAWQDNPQQYWQDAPEEVQAMILPMIENFYTGKAQLQRDEALRSVGLIAQTAMLAAKAMGYDSCPMIGFDADKVAELIKLPEDHLVGMMITIGKASKAAQPKPGQLAVDQVLVKNSF